MKNFLVFLANGCVCGFQCKCKKEVYKHFRSVVKCFEIY